MEAPNIYPLLPKLTLNRRFVQDLLAASEPCCAVGVIEERKQVLPLLALRPGVTLPDHITARGFEFGHSLLGDNDSEIVRFAFEFRGFATSTSPPSAPHALDHQRRTLRQGACAVLPAAGTTRSCAGVGLPWRTVLP